MNRLEITEVEVLPIINPSKNLVGYARITINNSLVLKAIAIFQKRSGELYLNYPSRKTSDGREFSLFHPVTRELGELIREAVRKEYESVMSAKDAVFDEGVKSLTDEDEFEYENR